MTIYSIHFEWDSEKRSHTSHIFILFHYLSGERGHITNPRWLVGFHEINTMIVQFQANRLPFNLMLQLIHFKMGK